MKFSLFFQILQNSVTSIKKYNHLLLLKNKIILYYFLVWLVFLSFLQACHFSLTTIPQVFSGLSHSLAEAVTYYPEDLVLEWNGTDTLSSNYESIPLYYPSGFDPELYSLPENFGVYSASETEPNLEELHKYFLVATPKEFHIQEVTGQWNSFEYTTMLGNTPTSTFTKSSAVALQSTWLEEKDAFQRFAQIVGAVIATVATSITTTLTLLFRAIIVLGIAKYLTRIQTNYIKTLKLSALFTIPALLIETAVIFFYGADYYGVSGFTFWLLFTLYLWFGKVTITQVPKKK